MARRAKIKDTDYLFLSAYVHAKETKLVGKERLMRMLESKSAEDAYKVLEECGWAPAGTLDAGHLDRILAEKREEAFGDMKSLAPDPKLVDLFRIKYDYHNAKVLIKSQAMGAAADDLLLGSGRILRKSLWSLCWRGGIRTFRKPLQTLTSTRAIRCPGQETRRFRISFWTGHISRNIWNRP